MSAADQLLLDSRRAFPMAQLLLAGHPVAQPRRLVVGWHDTSLDPETGAVLLVAGGGANEDLIGQRVRVQFGPDLFVVVYVVGSAELAAPRDVSLARRAYWPLARLSREPIVCQVAVIG